MTLTQVLLLLLVLLAVAVIAYRMGRASTPAQPSAQPPVPPTPEAWAVPAKDAQTSQAGTSQSARPPRLDQKPRPKVEAPRAEATPQSRAPAPAATAGQPRTWGYQLQKLDLARAADSPFDLIVIDTTKDGDDETAYEPGDIDRLKRKRDGSRRRVLAYLSIGEAESYRGYWDKSWKKQKPGWLLGENPDWDENYAVCYWDRGWQDIICGSPDARLDRIIAAGFDGVYLDKCDVYEDMRARRTKEARDRSNLEADMIAFIQRLSAHARKQAPGFLVVMQNAEALLEKPELRRALDGIAKEELVFGIDGVEKRNKPDEIEWSSEQLDLMQREGKMVLIVEYLNNQAKIDEAVRMIQPHGYALYVSDKNRELDRLNYETFIA